MFKHSFIALASAVTVIGSYDAQSVQAALITFDSLSSAPTYSSATHVSTGYQYKENGFTFTWNPNRSSTRSQPTHFGDAGHHDGMLNWHEQGFNGSDAYFDMTADSGDIFDIDSFDTIVLSGVLKVMADYGGGLVNVNSFRTGTGIDPGIKRAQVVRLIHDGYCCDGVSLDNISAQVSVPESRSSTALLGFGTVAIASSALKRKLGHGEKA